jgi:hypothetical protein
MVPFKSRDTQFSIFFGKPFKLIRNLTRPHAITETPHSLFYKYTGIIGTIYKRCRVIDFSKNMTQFG